MMFKTKSVYSPISRSDGFRILATRYRGRGLFKSRYHVWMANLAPSEALIRQIQSGKVSWSEFKRRYRREILTGDSFDKRNRTIKNHGQKFTLRLLQYLARRGTITFAGGFESTD
jgi:uncharacterized protein YeaO (DUF488 family)